MALRATWAIAEWLSQGAPSHSRHLAWATEPLFGTNQGAAGLAPPACDLGPDASVPLEISSKPSLAPVDQAASLIVFTLPRPRDKPLLVNDELIDSTFFSGTASRSRGVDSPSLAPITGTLPAQESFRGACRLTCHACVSCGEHFGACPILVARSKVFPETASKSLVRPLSKNIFYLTASHPSEILCEPVRPTATFMINHMRIVLV